MKRLAAGLFVGLMLLLAPLAAATAGSGFKTITTAELKKMLDSAQKPTLVYSLSPIHYQVGHIPGSINIPYTKMEGSSLLPPDKNTPLVFYCLGRK